MEREGDNLEGMTDLAIKVCTALMVVLITVIVFTSEPRYVQNNEELVRSVQLLYLKFSAVLEYKERVEELLLESYWYHAINEERMKHMAGSRQVTRQRFLYCQSQLQSLQMKYNKVQEDYRRLSEEIEILKNMTKTK